MLRQTAFGFALSMLVLASGLTTSAIRGNTSTSNQVALSTTTVKTTDLEKSVFNQINRYRVTKGLSKLSLSSKISRQARIHSQNMASGQVPFSHKGFEQRVNAIPIPYRSAAENLAFNRGYSDPANEAIIDWIHSPGHLHNLKGNYNLTGIGVAANNKGDVYLTQIFLRSRSR
ncbi:MAG: CAP domain-containing protein [Rhizonema sp. PD37]|nr:CAP domain-containing protein [Rhizonema sp. PD37]